MAQKVWTITGEVPFAARDDVNCRQRMTRPRKRQFTGSPVFARTIIDDDFGFDFYTRRCRHTPSSDRWKTPVAHMAPHRLGNRVGGSGNAPNIPAGMAVETPP